MVVLLPFFIFLFGIGETSKVIAAVFSGTLFIVLNTVQGVADSKMERRQFIEALARPSKLSIFRRVTLMETLPYIFTGIKTAISLILIVVLVAEMFFGGLAGLGYRIYQSQLAFDASTMMVYILVVGILSYLLNKLLSCVESKFFHWQGK